MHNDADERVEEHRTPIFPASLIKERLTLRRLSRGLDAAYIMMQTDE